ncbi:putative T7SS-secreted protein [Streptomyces daliensis]
MGLGDFTPDWLEDGAEKGAEMLGTAVDRGTDYVADRFDEAGAPEGATNWLRDKGDAAANRLGAQVGEARLGETEDPKKLIHGSVSTLRANASHLKDFQKAFEKVAAGLKGLDSEHLRGKAADAFREKVAVEPKKWHKAADACEKAAKALDDFAGTVDWAQGQAREALAKYRKAKAASDAHAEKVKTYQDSVDYGLKGDELPDKPADSDPGASGMQAAQALLDEARRQRDEAASTARTAVDAARDAAPPKPPDSMQLDSGLDGLKTDASFAAGGLIRGTAGLANFARGLNPQDPYNMTHPGAYVMNLNSTVTGLVRMSNDPVGTGKAMWDGFRENPTEFTARLIPEALGSKGMGLARKGLGAARRAPHEHSPGEDTRARDDLDRDGPQEHKTENKDRCSDDTDPVDLATGKMYLPQTDVALPGTLPLVFRRQVESGYRAGRWFGPSWASTVDQRLEIDAEGVVLVTEDGLLLPYPHPAPGVPTLPESGPRRPLAIDADGDYLLTDPESGHTRHFTGPAASGPGGDGVAPLEEISDRNGNRITFEYAPDGAPSRIAHSGGYELAVTTDNGRVTALSLVGAGPGSTGPEGAGPEGTDQLIKRYGYDERGNLTGVVNSSGLPLRFAYDEERRITSWTDTNDRRYDYVYDDRHRVVAEGGTDGHLQVRIAYEDPDAATGHRVTTLTTARGNTTRYLINRACQVVAVTDALGHTVRTESDRHGRLLSRTDALGRVTRVERDGEGRPVRVTRPDGRAREVAYGERGLPVRVVEADGARWEFAYDGRGNRVAVTDPAGCVTRYGYDARGHLASVTDALGAVTRVRCDAAGLPVAVTEPGGEVTRYERDAFGRPVVITDPVGAATRLEWTVEGRLARRTGPDGASESWAYDGEGNRVRHVDAVGGVTSYEYTHFDLLAARTGPDGVRYAFTHDAELRLTRVTDPHGLSWDYAYDAAGRLVSESDFDDREVMYGYDAAGQLESRTNPLGQTVAFERDVLGQVVRKDADGAVTTFGYDPAGRLLHAMGPDAEVMWQRDRLGRIKAEVVNGRATTYAWDAVGRRTRRVTPTGAVAETTYDSSGNRTSLTTGGRTVDFTRDAAGREVGRRVGDAVQFAQVWDPAGRLSAQTVTGGPSAATIQHRAWTYRADGHLVGVEDALNGPRVFDLDAAGRVTGVRAQDWTESYAYDETGNQTRAAWPAAHPGAEAQGTRTYTGTRLRTAGALRYEHDAAGRVVLRQKSRLSKKPDTWRYTWDAEDHLTSVTTPDGTVWRYTYDPLGRRIAKHSATERVDFTWDGPTLAEQTTTGPGLPDPVTLTWDHDGLRPLAQTERLTDATSQTEIDSRFFAIVTDLVGTPTELVDESGTLAWRTRTTLWGTTTWTTNATTYTPLRFPGQYFDPGTLLAGDRA